MTSRCFICSKKIGKWAQAIAIDDDLANTWQLTKGLRNIYNYREGMHCPNCYNSVRTIGLAKVMTKVLTRDSKDFKDFIDFANQKKLLVAEINSCGQLHSQLKDIQNIAYSEFKTEHFDTGKIQHQDIQNLTYQDNSFDLVLHSETLEHIADPSKALEECRRVLKPNGWCLFTVPVIWNRETRQRIKKVGNHPKALVTKSYHGGGRKDCVVWWEFGADFVQNNNLDVFVDDPSKESYVLGFQKLNNKKYSPNINKYRIYETLATKLSKKARYSAGELI